MSVTLIFGQRETAPPESPDLHVSNAIEPRSMLVLRGDTIYDDAGLALADRVVDQAGRVFWRPICRDNDQKLGDKTNWLCPEIAIVGQGRLNL